MKHGVQALFVCATLYSVWDATQVNASQLW